MTARQDSSSPSSLPYERVLLKLSGEALQDEKHSLNPDMLARIAGEIAVVHDAGVNLAIVVGGGNIFRGLAASVSGMDRTTADHMGMMATVINALALQDAIVRAGVPARVLSALAVEKVAELFVAKNALRYLANDREVLILAAGTGNPYFTTDTAAALRGAELHVDILLKATKVDGVFSDDPVKNPEAEQYTSLSYQSVLSGNLRVMDATAVSLCRENSLPIGVFNLFRENSIVEAVLEQKLGTIVSDVSK